MSSTRWAAPAPPANAPPNPRCPRGLPAPGAGRRPAGYPQAGGIRANGGRLAIRLSPDDLQEIDGIMAGAAGQVDTIPV